MSIQVLMADKNEEVIDEKKLTEESVESNLRPPILSWYFISLVTSG